MAAATVSYSEARENLASLINTVESTRDTIVITRRGHSDVVLINAEELSGLEETAHLLRSPANARRLLAAIRRSQAGKGEEMTLDELAHKSGAVQTTR